MPFTNARPFPYQMTPLSGVTPFTYRDGATYLYILERMQHWLSETLVPEFNAAIENAITEYQAGLGNAETYVDEAIQFINNKTGQAQTVRVLLTLANAPYTLEIDPLWPSNHPIDIVLTQDEVGNRVVNLGTDITGTLDVDPAPNARTEFTLIPQGDGTWEVLQLDKLFADVWEEFTRQAGLISTTNGNVTALTDRVTNAENAATGLAGRVTVLEDNEAVLTSPDGTRYLLGVTNAGTLTLTDLPA